MLDKMIKRVTQLNTTLGGTAMGVALAAVVHYVLVEQAQCKFDGIDWAAVWAFLLPTIQGALSSDSGKE